MDREITNQTYSNRVLRAEFDDNWKTTITKTGYVKYIALKNKASVELILSDGSERLVLFPKKWVHPGGERRNEPLQQAACNH
ncbi:Group-specific protein [Mesobacillus thioparans]